MPQKNSHGQYTNWYRTTLPWMSIGYESQVPPISTLTFYNAIANNGKMMKPRFVKRVMREGEILREYPPVVLKQQICKPSTLDQVRDMLRKVVSQGTGKKARSESFAVAGKTGTAQISKGRGGYKSGSVRYLVSFVGYFPADEPRYSCIVCLQKTGLPASGGTMSGWVFHNIAEGIMAHNLNIDAIHAKDSVRSTLPQSKSGNLESAGFVLNYLGYDTRSKWADAGDVLPFWGTVDHGGRQFTLQQSQADDKGIVPDVKGMGARDAVYVLESHGLKAQVVGRGKVVSQSVHPGTKVHRGEVCMINLMY